MTGFILKIIGIISMFFDHWGYFISDAPWLRDIGRFSFIIFSFLTVEGYRHTRNRKKYLESFFILGVVFQLPILILNLGNYKNIFITLFSGVIVLYLYDSLKRINFLFFTSLIVMGSIYFQIDYAFYGVLLPIIFYTLDKKKLFFYITLVLLHIVSIKMGYVMENQYLALFSLIFIYFYNGKEGIKMKKFFILFYPVHLGFIYLMKILFY